MLDTFKGKFVCSDEECDFSISQAKFTGSRMPEPYEIFTPIPWFTRLCQDDLFWQKDVFEAYPGIIAHEYWRLYDLLEQGHPYGAFLQLKDVFEVALKFPTLILISAIYQKAERSDIENNILSALLEKWLTLGTWEEIAKTLCKKSPIIPPVIRVLQDVITLFQDYDIREWRNKTIGHGALAFEADEDFQHDIEAKLRLLSTHFRRFSTSYASFALYLKTDERRIRLHGKDKARNLTYPDAEIWIRIGELWDLPLSPYMLFRDRGIYFFDSYVAREEKTIILNYPEGDKQYIRNNLFTNLYTTLSKDHTLKQLSGSLNDVTYSAFESETLDRIAVIDDFQKPLYLKKWLQDIAATHAKGVFLLQMERGMGKTTFVRALDQQSMSRIHLTEPDEFSARAYYSNGAYLYKAEHFTSRISFLLLTDNSGRVAIQGSLPVLSVHSSHKRQDFADLLNFYRREHHKHFHKGRLLCMLDGLDEVPASEEISIFDFLPSPDLLEEGVYLLLTCRTDAEISHFTGTQLDTIRPTATLSVARDDLRHIDVLRAYITNHIPQREALPTEFLLHKADHRFLYVKTLKELLKTSRKGPWSSADLPQGDTLFTDFLTSLENVYGEKFFASIVRLLAIFALAFEPLSLKELSYLFGEKQPSFKLLAHLLDLRGFLKIEQSYRGNLFSLAHEELRQVMCEKYHHALRAVIRGWIAEHADIDVTQFCPEDDGVSYLLTYLPDYVNRYARDIRDAVFTTSFAGLLEAFASKLQRESVVEHHRERTLELYSQAVRIQSSLLASGGLEDEQVLLETLINRGRAYSSMHRIEEAISDYDSVIDRQYDLLNLGRLRNEDRLAAVLINRGNAFMQLQFVEQGIADYTQAIAIRQRLFQQGDLIDESRLARVFVNRGAAYRRLGQLEEAVADFDQAIAIQDRCFETGTLKHEYEFAAALMNRGIMHMQADKTGKALSDYDRAIDFAQHLVQQGKLPDENYLARALINRAIVYERQYQPQNAIPDLTKAITIQEKLLNQGKLVNTHELARSFVNRGIAYKNCSQWQEAIGDYNRAMTLQKGLLQEGILLEDHELAWTLMNRGEAFTRIHQLEKAMTDFNRAIAIQEALLSADILPDERELALTLINRGIARTSQQQFEHALKDFDRALRIQKTLLRDGKFPDEDDMAWGLLHRGIACREHHQLEDAMTDFNRALALLKELQEAEKSFDLHDLALAFLHRGITYAALHEADHAFRDLQQAADITNSLLSARPFLLGTYAQSVFHRFSLLQNTDRVQEFRTLREEFHHVFRAYPLTEEASFWQNKFMDVGKETQ